MPIVPEPVSNIQVKNLNLYSRGHLVSWDPSPNVHVVGYKVYRSEVSYADYELITPTPLPATQTSFSDLVIPQVPPMPFLWWYRVTSVTASGGESSLASTLPSPAQQIDYFNNPPPTVTVPESLSEQGITSPTDSSEGCGGGGTSDHCPPTTNTSGSTPNDPPGLQVLPSTTVNPRWFLEIRRRHKWILEMGGVPVILLKRRWSGTRCPDWDPQRAQHKKTSSALISDPCYGTNIVGGYHTPIRILISLVSPAMKATRRQEKGMWYEFEPRSWALWEPNLLDRDIVVREDTGERFELLRVENTKWRGMVLRQNFDMKLLEPTAIEYKVPIS